MNDIEPFKNIKERVCLQLFSHGVLEEGELPSCCGEICAQYQACMFNEENAYKQRQILRISNHIPRRVVPDDDVAPEEFLESPHPIPLDLKKSDSKTVIQYPKGNPGQFPKSVTSKGRTIMQRPAGFYKIPFNSHSQKKEYYSAHSLCIKHGGIPYPDALEKENSIKAIKRAPVSTSQTPAPKPAGAQNKPAPAPGKEHSKFSIGEKVRLSDDAPDKSLLRGVGKITDIDGEMIHILDGGRTMKIFSGHLVRA